MRGKKTTLELQRYTTSAGTGGTVIKTWYGLRNISGVLKKLSGKEILFQDKNTVFSTHKFYCDIQPALTITEKDRLRCENSHYDIILINNRESKFLEMDLSLKE